jgi:hypothetical protein
MWGRARKRGREREREIERGSSEDGEKHRTPDTHVLCKPSQSHLSRSLGTAIVWSLNYVSLLTHLLKP